MASTPLKKIAAGIAIGLLIVLLVSLRNQAWAAPAPQYTFFPTPTPGPDGRIIYIAKEGDTAWRIAAIFGFTAGEKYNQLKTLNKWGDNPVIHPGDEILLGLAGPADVTVTPGPSPTPAPVTPTVTSVPGYGDLCVILFNDQNGDSLRQEEEPAIPNGAISVSDRTGKISKTSDTLAGLDPVCFEQLPEGVYNISVAPPAGYNPTTAMNSSITLKAGDQSQVDFGAQANTITLATAPTPEGSGKSPLMAIVGGVLLAAGIGLGIFGARLVRLGSANPKGE